MKAGGLPGGCLRIDKGASPLVPSCTVYTHFQLFSGSLPGGNYFSMLLLSRFFAKIEPIPGVSIPRFPIRTEITSVVTTPLFPGVERLEKAKKNRMEKTSEKTTIKFIPTSLDLFCVESYILSSFSLFFLDLYNI